MNIIYDICLILVLVGAINWGLVALFKFDLVAAIFAGGSHFGNINGLSRVIYGLVGLAALYVAFEYLI
ncbi:MAG: DUF378 domain-containing protein [Clostridium sp.]|nr:DUF378 domain-containing protein [Clostridium sp.]